MWLRSNYCPANEQCDATSESETSSTAFQVDQSETIRIDTAQSIRTMKYADGSEVKCQPARDTVFLGQTSTSSQDICLTTHVVDTSPLDADGIIGLAPPAGISSTINSTFAAAKLETASTSFFHTLNSLFHQMKVSFWYDVDSTYSASRIIPSFGQATIGGADASKYKGDMVWLPIINESKLWILPLSGYGVHPSTPCDFPSCDSFVTPETPIQAFMDTGTTMIVVPSRIYRFMQRFFTPTANTSSTFFIDCNSTHNMPSISFQIGTTLLTLMPSQLFVKVTPTLCLSVFQKSGTSDEESDAASVVFGSLFLRNFYTTFDGANRLIGVAVPIEKHSALISSISSTSNPSSKTTPANGSSNSKLDFMSLLQCLLLHLFMLDLL